jgi:predicted phage terminase large subunit-like protein
VARANSCSHLPEQGKVILLKGQWNEPYISELEDFPDGEFDDQVDSTTQKLNDFIKRRKTTETYGVSRYDL